MYNIRFSSFLPGTSVTHWLAFDDDGDDGDQHHIQRWKG